MQTALSAIKTVTQSQNFPAHACVNIELGQKAYSVLVGAGLLAHLGTLALTLCRPKALHILITDSTVCPLYLKQVEATLKKAGLRVASFIIPAGESSKSFAQFTKLVEQILTAGIERKSTVFALGGGVVGDLAGYIAASLLRGVPFIQIPTTVLAQVDSSVGGKTGINVPQGKNLVGAFYQPQLVLCDTDTLKTLTARQKRAGYGEIVKYGLIDKPWFFEWLLNNGVAFLAGDEKAQAYAIEVSCKAKADIVAQDEKESGVRGLLNLGHTFGHALEAEVGYNDTLFHGEAVALGMVMAFKFSNRLGFCSSEDVLKVETHLQNCGLPICLKDVKISRPWRACDLYAHMKRDKKVKDGTLHFVLTKGIGKAFMSKVTDIEALKAFLHDFCQV